MLKDRKILVQSELTKLTDIAAHMYLDIVTHDGDPNDPTYAEVREKITNLQHDLLMIQNLLDKGYE